MFGGLVAFGRRSAEVAFFPGFGLPGATRPLRGATCAPFGAFCGCTVAAAGGLACSSAFDVMSISWYGKCRIQDIGPSDVAARQATLCDKTLRISLISSGSFPNM